MVLFFNCFRAEDHDSRPKKRFDKTMIGNPTNFVHTVHMGVNSIANDTITSENMDLLRTGIIPTNENSSNLSNSTRNSYEEKKKPGSSERAFNTHINT
ncbi:hypothetical protein BB560_000155 [Smittium megazygosporum]|uniref:CRIB domain-containing protein n=1 Tax=Smittium megazygosporum TaxID=133381 RepID=A0A2T9ZL51_9FUNG|nr:hypothetical protein BB560_000155 [Smittium megazygosporum]